MLAYLESLDYRRRKLQLNIIAKDTAAGNDAEQITVMFRRYIFNSPNLNRYWNW